MRRAALGALPLVALAMLALLFTTRFVQTSVVSGLLLVLALGLLWRGQGWQRGLGPGVLAGAFPLTTTLCAARVGHACTGPTCMTLCLAASILGGVGAGVLVARWSVRRGVGPMTVALASIAGLLTAAMGSTCLGTRGLIFMLASFAVSLGVTRLASRAPEAA